MSTLLTADAETLRDCVTALRGVADSKLTPSLQRRMHELGERKESLTEKEHDELVALVEFAEERTIEKLRAMLALKRLEQSAPELFENP